MVGRLGGALGPWAWTIDEVWIGAAALAATVAASAYFAIRYLQGWLGHLHLVQYLDWYLLYAWGFLSWASMMSFVQDLLPLPESQLLRCSPVSFGQVYLARFAYCVLFNLVFFVSVTVPPAVVLGLRAPAGQSWYFAVLPVAVVAMSLAGAVVGALLAVPVAVIIGLLPEQWVPLLFRPEGKAMMVVWYLVLTCFLPGTSLQTLPGRGGLLSSWVTDLLTTQGVGFAAVRLAATLLGLFFLSGWIYSRFPRRSPEERARFAGKRSMGRVSFRRCSLLWVELQAGARDFAIGGLVLVGSSLAGLVGILAGGPERGWNAGMSTVWMTIYLGWLPIVKALRGASETTLHTHMFLVARTSPTPLLRLALLRFAVLTVGGTIVGLVLAGTVAGLLRHSGEPTWAVPLLALSLLVPCMVVPLMAVELALDALAMPWPKRPGTLKTYAHWLFRVGACLAGVIGTLFLWGFPRLRPPGELAVRALSGATVSVAVVFLVLWLVQRRLERVEWL